MLRAVAAERVRAQIVAEDEEDVGFGRGGEFNHGTHGKHGKDE
jgi:hypothetical protein